MDKGKILHDIAVQLAIQSNNKQIDNDEIKKTLKNYLNIYQELDYIFEDVQELRATEELERKRMVEAFSKPRSD